MGDPRKMRKKYSTPPHPWQEARIEEEKGLLKEYGLKNKHEIWKMKSLVKGYADQMKHMVASRSEQAKLERAQLVKKLVDYGLVKENASMDDILGLTVRNIMERRLQTIMFRKGMAKSPDQARQFIVHGHVMVGTKKMNRPSYLVATREEDKINFLSRSPFASAEHPERAVTK